MLVRSAAAAGDIGPPSGANGFSFALTACCQSPNKHIGNVECCSIQKSSRLVLTTLYIPYMLVWACRVLFDTEILETRTNNNNKDKGRIVIIKTQSYHR